MENYNNGVKNRVYSIPTSSNETDIINLRDLFLKYTKRWYWFVLSLIIMLIIATFYIKKTETKYQVQTKILLRSEATNPGQMMMMESLGLVSGSRVVEDEIQVISSNNILKQTIDTLGLQVEYYQREGLKYAEMYKDNPLELNSSSDFLNNLKKTLTLDIKETSDGYKINVKTRGHSEEFEIANIQESFNTSFGKMNFRLVSNIKKGSRYRVKVYSPVAIINKYSTNMTVAPVNKQTNAIQVSIVEANVNKGKDFLNKLIDIYNLDAIEDKNIIARNTAVFINDQLANISEDLYNVESNVESFKRSNTLTDLTSEAGIFLESSQQNEVKLAQVETQLNMINAVDSYIQDPNNSNKLIPANIITNDATLAMSIQEYNSVMLERMKMAQTAKKSNPALVQLDQQLAALKSNVLASINSVKSGFRITRNDLRAKIAQYNTKLKNVPTQERKYVDIKRDQEITQNLYIFLSQKKLENELSLASTAPASRTIDKAYAGIKPVKPKKMIVYLVAMLLGLIIPFVFIWLKDVLNNKVEDVREYQENVNTPYLGSIGVSRDPGPVIVKEGSTTPVVEMFRLIRTNLQFMLGNKQSPVILITSSMSGEGKSFTSINLSMSFALMKKRVILVGLDIRSPMLAEYLEISTGNYKGTSVYLSDSTYKPEDIIEKTKFHDFFDVISSGPIPPNPAELLMNKRLDELIAYLRQNYDYVILDTAPIGMVSDTYLLNRFTDCSIYISRKNYTPKDAYRLINEIYEDKRLNNMGVVLNGTDASSSYGYGYGYGGDKKKLKKKFKYTFGDKLTDFIRKKRKK